MDNQGQKDPGIAIQHVRLLKAHIEMVSAEGKPEYNLRLTGLRRFESQDGNFLDLLASFDVMHGVEKPLFKFTCDFIVRYERKSADSMPWKAFGSAMALAHVIPYLREFVSNMTNRLPAPVLLLDPINTHVMVEEFEQRSRQAEPARQAAATPA